MASKCIKAVLSHVISLHWRVEEKMNYGSKLFIHKCLLILTQLESEQDRDKEPDCGSGMWSTECQTGCRCLHIQFIMLIMALHIVSD